jgi:hypothetical protein
MERSRCTHIPNGTRNHADILRHSTLITHHVIIISPGGDYEANETIKRGEESATSLGSVRPQPSGGSCRSFSMNNKQPGGQDEGTIEREKHGSNTKHLPLTATAKRQTRLDNIRKETRSRPSGSSSSIENPHRNRFIESDRSVTTSHRLSRRIVIYPTLSLSLPTTRGDSHPIESTSSSDH